MTNEEAIKQIKQSYPAYKEFTAIDWAVKALEGETELLERVKKLELSNLRKISTIKDALERESELEKALKLACEQLKEAMDYIETNPCYICPCCAMPDCNQHDCIKHIMNAFKTKAGIEA